MKPIGTIFDNLDLPPVSKKKKSPKRNLELVECRNQIVFQHNNLIEAKYKLSLQEKRVILWLAAQIKCNDEHFKKHQIKALEFCNILGIEFSYQYIHAVIKGLMQKVITIKHIEEDRLSVLHWVNYAQYYFKEGIIELNFHPELSPYLLNLKEKFTTISLSDLMRFKSIHAIRIYELLKQYQDIGERTLTIETIKECCGVKDKLKQYGEFEKYLLLVAQREINEKSDIKFEFERQKHVRKITSIKFIISKNKAYELRNGPQKQSSYEFKRTPMVINTLEEFGLSKRVINQILKENTEQAIQDAINAVDLQIDRGHARNPKAMLMVAIKEKWHPERFQAIKKN